MTPPDLSELGAYIARHRQERGLTQEALGEAVGVSDTTILRLERGDFGRPDPDKLTRIAHALGLEAEDLFALARYTAGDGLPGFGPYLRAKFGDDLPPHARRELEQYFEWLRSEHGEGTDAKPDR